jgi:hypothetical protein
MRASFAVTRPSLSGLVQSDGLWLVVVLSPQAEAWRLLGLLTRLESVLTHVLRALVAHLCMQDLSSGRGAGVSVDPNTYGSCPYIAFGYPMSMTSGREMELYPYRHVARGCDVEDVVIQGRGRTPHPIHIHVNHGQVGNLNARASTMAWRVVAGCLDAHCLGGLDGFGDACHWLLYNIHRIRDI